MRLTLRRLAAVFLAAVLLEVVTFAVVYDDLLYLRRPADALVSTPGTFARHATTALSRRKLTAQHLEAIAGTAQTLGLRELETRALEHRVSADPSDRRVRLRLADALRRAGRHHDAERIYLDVLESTAVTR